MKIKKLSIAMAVASIAASGSALAGGPLNTVLDSANANFQVFGGYMDREWDIEGGGDFDESDFDFDRARIGVTGIVKENVSYGLEVEWLLHDADLTGSQDSSSTSPGSTQQDENDVRVNKAYLLKQKGDITLILGRYKQAADRGNHIRLADRVFNTYSPSAYGPIGMTVGDISSDLGINSQFAIDQIGADRHVDGAGINYVGESGIHGSFNIYKGGVNEESDELSRNFGYAGSIGWLGGDNDMQFGVTLSAFQEDGSEVEGGAGQSDAELENSGMTLEAVFGTGPINAGLTYGDASIEFDDPDDILGGGAIDDDELEIDNIGIWVVYDVLNAARDFNPMAVLGGPSVAPQDLGVEFGARYSKGEIDLDGVGDADQESYGIAVNVYCGSFTKWFFEYDASEYGDSGEVEITTFSIGGRVDL